MPLTKDFTTLPSAMFTRTMDISRHQTAER